MGLCQWPVPALTSPEGERADFPAEILPEVIPPLGTHCHLQLLHQVLITCTVTICQGPDHTQEV